MFIDLHCDALYCVEREGGSLASRGGSVDFKRLEKGDALCQCFAAFVDLAQTSEPYAQGKKLAMLLKSEIAAHSNEVEQAYSAADIKRIYSQNKIPAMLTIEEGEVCCGEIEKLHEFYELGARIMTLTWNYKNSLAAPNTAEDNPSKAVANTENGLTPTGFDFVCEMNRLHMIVDVSHLSDRGFYEVLSHSSRPPIASHSNAREITPHPRNLTDDMIRRLSRAGGIMGLNFAPGFLSSDKKRVARVEDMLRHLKHIKQVGGIEVMALGTDFDGISGNLEIKDSAALPFLAQSMKAAGFTEGETEAVFYKNALRVFEGI